LDKSFKQVLTYLDLELTTEEATIPKPEIEIPFNDRTFQAMSKESIESPFARRSKLSKERHDRFRAKFKPEKGPLQKIINQMVRKPVITYDEKGKAVKKDHLVYNYDVIGFDWLGNRIMQPDVEGYYYKPKFTTTTSLNPKTGEPILHKHYAGEEQIFYIELTEKNRKKVIEDIINKSNGSTIDQITFVARLPHTLYGPEMRNNQFTYDQFINSDMDTLEKLARKEGGPQGIIPHSNKDTKPYMG